VIALAAAFLLVAVIAVGVAITIRLVAQEIRDRWQP